MQQIKLTLGRKSGMFSDTTALRALPPASGHVKPDFRLTKVSQRSKTPLYSGMVPSLTTTLRLPSVSSLPAVHDEEWVQSRYTKHYWRVTVEGDSRG